MNQNQTPADSGANDANAPEERASHAQKPRVALRIIDVVLTIEALALVALVIWLIFDLLVMQPSSYATAIALTVLVAIGAIWLVATAIASLRRVPWSRPSAIVWQVLQLSVAVGAFQGLFARADIGWVLLVPALAVIVLMLRRQVRFEYTPDEQR